MPDSRLPLSVVVPAYREAEGIYDAIELLTSTLDAFGMPYAVIVVSDGNTDGTEKEAARHAHQAVRVIHYEPQRGKGFALRRGIGETCGDTVAYIDADMELHPAGLVPLIRLVEDGADAAVGSKRHPDSQVSYPRFRRFQSQVYQGLIHRLFDLDVSDTQTGIKAFRGDLLRDTVASATSDGFAFDLELLAELRYRGALIVEGPVQLDYTFSTTTGVAAVFDVLHETSRIYLRLRKRHRPPVQTPARRSSNSHADRSRASQTLCGCSGCRSGTR
jgi:glycosyltransferase involved in cell wall biosynthesis